MINLIMLLLLIWPFSEKSAPGRTHSRNWHSRHYQQIQKSREKATKHAHGAPHPSLSKPR